MQVSKPQFRKPMIVITALVLIGLCAGTIPSFFQRSAVSVTVTAAPVSHVNKPLYIERGGSSVHATMVPVYSEGAGRVSDVYVTLGQTVKAGQPLVKLEITSGASQSTTASAPASIDVSSATNDVYEKALQEYNRYKMLYELGAIPRKQLEAAEARMQAVSSSSQSNMAVAPVRKSTVLSGPVTIQASIDGTITGNVVAVGSGIQEGQELMALGSGQEVEIAVPLEQKELYFIELGSQAVIEVAGQQLTGQVSGIYPEVKDKEVVSFMAHVKLVQPPGNLLTPGMPVSVRLPTGQEVATMAIPSQALLLDEKGQYFIFFASQGKAIRQQIAIGEAIGDFREVTTAIPQDSLVITNHIDTLKNGDNVTVVE